LAAMIVPNTVTCSVGRIGLSVSTVILPSPPAGISLVGEAAVHPQPILIFSILDFVPSLRDGH
jgi:hypothetical protein